MIPVSEPDIGEKEIEYVDDAVRSGWVSSHGEYINRFEDNFKSFIGTKFGLTTSNGTTAIHLALSAMGIKEGDEVIVPDLTFISPVNAVLYNHATPVLCDIDPENWCIDTEKIEKLITEKTKAIIVVHLYGNSANMDRIMEIKKKYNLYLIEDTITSSPSLIPRADNARWIAVVPFDVVSPNSVPIYDLKLFSNLLIYSPCELTHPDLTASSTYSISFSPISGSDTGIILHCPCMFLTDYSHLDS